MNIFWGKHLILLVFFFLETKNNKCSKEIFGVLQNSDSCGGAGGVCPTEKMGLSPTAKTLNPTL